MYGSITRHATHGKIERCRSMVCVAASEYRTVALSDYAWAHWNGLVVHMRVVAL